MCNVVVYGFLAPWTVLRRRGESAGVRILCEPRTLSNHVVGDPQFFGSTTPLANPANMINAVLVFNNNGQPRLVKFYSQIVLSPRPLVVGTSC